MSRSVTRIGSPYVAVAQQPIRQGEAVYYEADPTPVEATNPVEPIPFESPTVSNEVVTLFKVASCNVNDIAGTYRITAEEWPNGEGFDLIVRQTRGPRPMDEPGERKLQVSWLQLEGIKRCIDLICTPTPTAEPVRSMEL